MMYLKEEKGPPVISVKRGPNVYIGPAIRSEAPDTHVYRMGDDVPILQRDCIEVQADGDELAYLKNEFVNLPYNRRASVQVWKGELAQFIYDNMTPRA